MKRVQRSDVGTKTANVTTDHLTSYIISSIVSCVLYAVGTSDLEIGDIMFSIYVMIAGGFLVGQALMGIPWAMAVRYYGRTDMPGWLYFPALGAVGIVILGCTTAILVPKLLVVEDQTFLELTIFTLKRDGFCLLITGLIFGLIYWFLGVRQRS